MQVKYGNFLFCKFYNFVYFFLVKICWNLLKLVFAFLSYDFITSSHIIAESFIILAKYFPFSQLHIEGFQIWFCFTYIMFFTLTSTFTVIPLLTRITFYAIKVTLHLHDTCFVNVFNSFIPVIMLSTHRFKSSV